jgi:hypothetical protein
MEAPGSFYDYPKINYYHSDKIIDIEKGLAFLVAKNIKDCNNIESVIQKGDEGEKHISFGKWYDSEFFEFKCFKKGTIHMKFKSESLWDKFNMVACEGKNWIGSN